MGLVHADVVMKNLSRPQVRAAKVRVLADSGAVNLCIPPELCARLKLEVRDVRTVTLADGSSCKVRYVGPIELRFKNRSCIAGALVMGEQPLLGAIPMEDMDLVILPRKRRLDVNPDNPDMAGAIVANTPTATCAKGAKGAS